MPAEPTKAVVLLSGGLDSTVAAWLAADNMELILALTVDYGQKAFRRETAAAYATARRLDVDHRVFAFGLYRMLDAGALLDPAHALPEPSARDLDDIEGAARESASAVWVPNRNGLLVAIGAAWAESIGADALIVGFNAEEAATFPDNSAEFIARQSAALELSTANSVRLVAPTAEWTKERIVREAHRRDWPLEWVWSCYDGEMKPCMRCESCRRLERAIDAAGAREWYEKRVEEGGI